MDQHRLHLRVVSRVRDRQSNLADQRLPRRLSTASIKAGSAPSTALRAPMPPRASAVSSSVSVFLDRQPFLEQDRFLETRQAPRNDRSSSTALLPRASRLLEHRPFLEGIGSSRVVLFPRAPTPDPRLRFQRLRDVFAAVRESRFASSLDSPGGRFDFAGPFDRLNRGRRHAAEATTSCRRVFFWHGFFAVRAGDGIGSAAGAASTGSSRPVSCIQSSSLRCLESRCPRTGLVLFLCISANRLAVSAATSTAGGLSGLAASRRRHH